MALLSFEAKQKLYSLITESLDADDTPGKIMAAVQDYSETEVGEDQFATVSVGVMIDLRQFKKALEDEG
jgi:hypothetical protein